MLKIIYSPTTLIDGAKVYNFSFTHPELENPVNIGRLRKDEFNTEKRYDFVSLIYRKLESFGFERDSIQHTRSMVDFFACLDHILGIAT